MFYSSKNVRGLSSIPMRCGVKIGLTVTLFGNHIGFVALGIILGVVIPYSKIYLSWVDVTGKTSLFIFFSF